MIPPDHPGPKCVQVGQPPALEEWRQGEKYHKLPDLPSVDDQWRLFFSYFTQVQMEKVTREVNKYYVADDLDLRIDTKKIDWHGLPCIRVSIN